MLCQYVDHGPLVLSFSKPTAVGLAKVNDAPVRPEEAFKLPITVYTIYGIPLWMVNNWAP
jgi:hypothetical protein